jgi:hypothetical protein
MQSFEKLHADVSCIAGITSLAHFACWDSGTSDANIGCSLRCIARLMRAFTNPLKQRRVVSV